MEGGAGWQCVNKVQTIDNGVPCLLPWGTCDTPHNVMCAGRTNVTMTTLVQKQPAAPHNAPGLPPKSGTTGRFGSGERTTSSPVIGL